MFSQIMCNSTHACTTKNVRLEGQKVITKHVRCCETGCDSYYNRMYWIFFGSDSLFGSKLIENRITQSLMVGLAIS